MDVILIAYTHVNWTDLTGQTPFTMHPSHNHPADVLAEFAGRACYESWSRPNPATDKNFDYIGHIIDQEHFSVLEHASATFYLRGVSRSLTHELVRHRQLSFSQLSQRFVDESDVDTVIPPGLTGSTDTEAIARGELDRVMVHARRVYESIVYSLVERGATRREARQAARAVLPNMTETRIVVTGNHRAWRDVIAKRNHPAADAEIQQLARALLVQLKRIAPATYQDMV